MCVIITEQQSATLPRGGGYLPTALPPFRQRLEIISPSHIIFPFTQCLNGTLFGFLSHLLFPPSLSFSLCRLLPRPLLAHLSLPVCPFCLFSDPFLALLFSHSDLTEGLCTEVTLVTLSPFFLSLSLWRKITHSSVCRLCSRRAGSQGEY